MYFTFIVTPCKTFETFHCIRLYKGTKGKFEFVVLLFQGYYKIRFKYIYFSLVTVFQQIIFQDILRNVVGLIDIKLYKTLKHLVNLLRILPHMIPKCGMENNNKHKTHTFA